MSSIPITDNDHPLAGEAEEVWPETLERRDLFVSIRRIMWIAVMCPLKLERLFPRCLHWFATLLDLVIELFLYFLVLHILALFVYTLLLTWGDGNLETFVNNLMQIIIYSWTLAMKLYFRRIQGRNLVEMMDSVNSNYATHSAKGFTYVRMDDSLAMSNKFTNIYAFFCFGGTIFWAMVPLVYGDRTLPLPCSYPFDYKRPIVYECMYFLQFVGQIQVAAAFAGSSSMQMAMSILLSGQYDVLYCSLKNILATVYIDLQKSTEELRSLRIQYRLSDAELNQYYCSSERSVKFWTTPRPRPARDQRNTKDFRFAYRRALKSCVNQHRYVLSSLKKMEYFFNPIWFLKAGEVVFLMCLVAFVSVKSTTANSSLFKIVSLGQYLVLVAWEMLIICYFGEIIYLNSLRCGEALMRSPWHLHATEMKSDILIFLLNARRSFKLSAGKIYALNVDLFRGIMTTAFSFLTLLQEMDS